MHSSTVLRRCGFGLLGVVLALSGCRSGPIEKPPTARWAAPLRGEAGFAQARFGMFVHWSPAVLPIERWPEVVGVDVSDSHAGPEKMWFMRRGEIPVADYEAIAAEFNPVNYDPAAWVRIARAAGMQYIVLTSKHHDGFAMFDSALSTWDIMDASPYRRDIVAALADACHEQQMAFGLYYSHAQDWHEPGGAGNIWDFPPDREKDFDAYFRGKCLPQVRELCTHYGRLDLLWFDTPALIEERHSRELYDTVKQLQGDCVVNSRIGYGLGDYLSTADNQIPDTVLLGPWEVPATINDHWTWRADQTWKSTGEILGKLVSIVSRGGNYLLNVGPRPDGTIPPESAARLQEVGRWLAVNGAAIYGAGPNPFLGSFEWGVATTRPGRIYLHVWDWSAGTLTLPGLRNRVQRAYRLADGRQVPFRQVHHDDLDLDVLSVELVGAAPDPYVAVIGLEIDGAADVDTTAVQAPDGRLQLEAVALGGMIGRQGYALAAAARAGARLHSPHDPPQFRLQPQGRGWLENWTDPAEWISWEFVATRAGALDVVVDVAVDATVERVDNRRQVRPLWEGGHVLRVDVAGQTVTGPVTEPEDPDRLERYGTVATVLGTVTIPRPGRYTLALRPQTIGMAHRRGLLLRAVRLEPR